MLTKQTTNKNNTCDLTVSILYRSIPVNQQQKQAVSEVVY